MRDPSASAWARQFLEPEPVGDEPPRVVGWQPRRLDVETTYAVNMPARARAERRSAARRLRTCTMWCLGGFLSTPLSGPIGFLVGIIAGVAALFALCETASTQMQVTLLEDLHPEDRVPDR